MGSKLLGGQASRDLQVLTRLLNFSDSLNRKKFSVACIGPYNHGKSSLLNALTGSYDDSRFKVEDRRTTDSIQKFVFKRGQNSISYVDSPGLGHSESDEKVALGGILEAGLLLYVHDVSHGELKEDEISYLHSLRNVLVGECFFGECLFVNRTIFVLTKKEGCSGDIDSTISAIRRQIFHENDRDRSGVVSSSWASCVDIVAVSARSYKKGRLEKKPLLAEKSGVIELEKLIDKKIDALKSNKGILKALIKSYYYQVHRSMIEIIYRDNEKLINLLKETIDLGDEICSRFNEGIGAYNDIC